MELLKGWTGPPHQYCKSRTMAVLLLTATMALALFGEKTALPRPARRASATALPRRAALGLMGGSAFALVVAPGAAPAADSKGPAAPGAKSRGLSEAELTKRLLTDIVDNQFMVTGKVSEDLYSDAAKFTDEIDTYDLKNFAKGTGMLFDAGRSEFKLVGDLEFSNSGKTIRYRFDEILSFKIPLQPRSRVSGVVELTRGEDGLLTQYREFWDQAVPAVLLDLVRDGFGLKRAAFT